MTVLNSILLLAALAAAPAQAAPAQMEPAVTQAETAAPQPGDSALIAGEPAPRQNSGLPARAPVAQTMAAYWPVFAAFVVAWLGIVAFVLSFGKPSEKLAQELAALEADVRTNSAS